MFPRFVGVGLASLLSAVLLASGLRADTVQLANGDLLSGEVLSLDAKQLKIKSQVLGEITIPRAKVQAITLGDAPARPSAADTRPTLQGAGAKPPAAGSLSIEDLLKQLGAGGAAGGTPGASEDLLKQLQSGGVSPGDLDKLKKQFPLLASPEVQGYVNKTLGGLIDGSLSIGDIRNQAIRARDETKEAIKDLGPEAEQALKGYLGILDQFIKETEPKPPAATPAPPPAAPRPTPKR
jgi:hypothetical protein